MIGKMMTTPDLSRRSLLGDILSVPVAMIAARAPAFAPVLRADGIHDDTDALQGLFDGRPFIAERATVLRNAAGDVLIRGGEFRFTRVLRLPAARIHFRGSIWLMENGAHLDMRRTRDGMITGCAFTTEKGSVPDMRAFVEKALAA
jgi:hypothetical protein